MSAKSIKNEALIDLEEGLSGQLVPVWEDYWDKRGNAIVKAAEDGKWDAAHEKVNALDLGIVYAKRATLFEQVGMAAVLLGASRLGRVDRTSVYKDPPKDWLTAALRQAKALLEKNATSALRHELHVVLDKYEYAASPSNSATVAEVIAKAVKGKDKYVPQSVRAVQSVRGVIQTVGTNRGTTYSGLTANLHTSRLNSAGFLLEAAARGDGEYQISEVMDGLTCPVCARFHGQKFAVRDGIMQLANVFGASDPTVLQSIAPWPKADRNSVARLARMTTADMVAGGLHLPPYHPSCRGIIVPTGTIPVVEGLTGAGAVLGDRLLGDRSDLDDDAAGLFEFGGTSALYSAEANDSVVDDTASDEHDDNAAGELLESALRRVHAH